MGIDDCNVIDLISQKKGVYYLHLILDKALTDSDLMNLQQKLNNYLAYGLDGQLVEDYPDAKDKDICIVVESSEKFEGLVLEFMNRFNDICTNESVGLEFRGHNT